MSFIGWNVMPGRVNIQIKKRGKCKRCGKWFTKRSLNEVERDFCKSCNDFLAEQEAEYIHNKRNRNDDLDWINK